MSNVGFIIRCEFGSYLCILSGYFIVVGVLFLNGLLFNVFVIGEEL